MKLQQRLGEYVSVFIFCGLIQALGTSSQTLTQDTGCRETWIRNSNTHAYGGTKFAAVIDEDRCFATCIARSNCIAIEINTNFYPAECWIFTDRNLLNSSVFLSGYNQYIIQNRCPQGQASVCRDRWELLMSSKARGRGTFIPNIDNADQCLNTCLINLQCLAVDVKVEASPIECYVQTNQSALVNPLYTEEYRLYVLLSRCDNITAASTIAFRSSTTVPAPVSSATTTFPATAPDVSGNCWSSLSQKNSEGATNVNYATVRSCQAYCISVSQCVAIDYDTGSIPPCWIHTDPNNLNITYDAPTVVQYRLDRSCSSSSTSIPTSIATTSQTPRPSSTACWNDFQRRYSIYGEPRNYFDVLSCQNYCASVSTCVAIDFDTSSSEKCWVHNNPRDLLPDNTYFDNPFVTQYQIIRDGTCASSTITSLSVSTVSSTSISTNSATTSQTPGPPVTVCWSEFPRQYSDLGQSQNYFDVLSCQNYCASVSTCVAIDFDTSSSEKCWVHNNPRDLLPDNTYFDNPFVTQYQINRNGTCKASTFSGSSSVTTVPVCSAWSMKSSSQSEGGEQATYNTVGDCQNYCITLPQCVAIDFDTTSDPPCWIHNDPNNLLIVVENPAVTQYLLNRGCLTTGSSVTFTTISSTSGSTYSLVSDCPRWTILPETNSINGYQVPYNNIYTCTTYCDNLPSCVAVDFDPITTPPCWIHTNSDDISFNNTYYSQTNKQYRINRRCSGTIGTETSTISSTTSSPGTQTTSAVVCAPRWIRYSGRLSVNAAQYLGYNTVTECIEYCASVPECVAVDFDSTPTASYGCWLHMNPSDLFPNNTYSPSYDVAQYIIDRTCPTVTTLAPNCAAQWSFRNNTSSSGGLHYFQYRTVDDCQRLCSSLPDCVAVDFNTDLSQASGGCYVHTKQSDLDNQYEAVGVQQYRIIGTNCGTITGPGGCFYQWSQPYYEQNIGGGVPTRDATFGDCQDRCIRVPSCLGIDIDTSPERYAYCWLTVMPGQLTPYPGVTHYELTRGPACPEVNTSPTSTVTTVSTTMGVTGPYGVCPFYREMANTNANGGTSQGTMTAEQCLSKCIQQYPYCVAIDYRKSDSRCYHQNSLSGRQWNSCCTRYELVCRTSNCSDSFAMFPNLVPSLPGYPQPTITTRGACEAACFANSSCRGYTLARTPRYEGYDCVLSFATIGSTNFAAENDLYIRQFCRSTVPPTETVTPPPTPTPGYCLLDIVFVVDNSGSIIENQPDNMNNHELIRMFLRRMLQAPVEVGPFFDHVGVVKFETSAVVMYDLCDVQNVESINVTAINGLPIPSGETNTPAALRLAYDMLFSSTGCGRRYAKPVVVLITDGVTTLDFRPDLKGSIDALKAEGATNVAVGITDQINMEDLYTFASTSDDVGIIQTFQELIYEEARVLNRLVGLCGRSTLATISRPPNSTPTTISTSTTTAASTSATATTTFQSTLSSSSISFSSTTATTVPSSFSTTTLPQPIPKAFAFSAGRSGNVNSPVSPIPLDFVLSNVGGSYNSATYSFTTPSVGIYFAEICVGLQPGQPAAVSLVQGGTTVLGLAWQSQIHNGTETACRAGLLQLLPSVTLSLSLDSGALYSANLETMLSVFSVTDAMTDDARSRTVFAVGSPMTGQVGFIPLSATIGGSSGAFDTSTSSYTCTASGLYFFSVTLGSKTYAGTRVDLTGLSSTIELTRNSEQYNGITTLSRSVLMPCPAQAKIRLNITFGDITNYTAYQLISFAAFPYLPRGVSSTAWALFKDYSSDTQSGPMDPFYFNIIVYNDNGLYDSNTRQVTIRTSGYYYVYMSSGFARYRSLMFNLKRNGATLFAINHQTTSTNAEDSEGHGAVVALNANDVLKVVGEVNTYSYSSVRGLQTSFFGMLLYGFV